MSGQQPKPKISLGIYRCASCGDTFPALEDAAVRCPTCGSEDAEPASEPLL